MESINPICGATTIACGLIVSSAATAKLMAASVDTGKFRKLLFSVLKNKIYANKIHVNSNTFFYLNFRVKCSSRM